MKLRIVYVLVGFLSLVLSVGQVSFAQTSSQTASALPHLVRFGGTVKDLNGSPLTGIVGLTFSLYSEASGGTALWLETQNVTADSSGHYTALLGSTKADGLPAELFTSEQARWVGVQVSGQAEQSRVLLVSAPYALKAGDAETIGGLPPSAFLLAAPTSGNSPNGAGGGPNAGTTAGVTGSGTADFVPLWTANSILGNSVLFQLGSGNTATVGINTTTPAATLDVNGSVISRGALQLPSTGTATAGGGFNSQPFSLQGSSFNSSTQKAIGPLFQWQTEPSGNNTSSPAGTLNLLYGSGSGSPAETGLNIASNGRITFATGQTFPGTGTITGVTTASGSGLTGGGTSGNLNLALTNTCAANQILEWSGSAWVCATIGGGGTITGVTAGTDLTGGGTSGTVTLNLDITKVPQLNTANGFTGNQSITGNLAATGSVSGAAATFTGVVTEAGALLPAIGTATATQGYNSQPLDSLTSVYNSGAAAAQNQDFRWLAEPVGNNTSSPSGKLDLLFGANGTAPTETGLSVASNGQITFATGQTFPGGGGTVTSVGSGLGLKGGPITTSGTLTIDTTVVPQLSAANTFTGNQTVTGNFTASSNASDTITGNNYATGYSGVTGNGVTTGVYGNASTTGTGVSGFGATGVQGQSQTGYGVSGFNTSATATAPGVIGATNSPTGYGVEGQGPGTAVLGLSSATTGGAGVDGGITSPTGYGVYGLNSATTGNAPGVYGTTSSSAGYGVEGQSSNIGVYGSGTVGVDGVTSAAAGAGVTGYANATTGFANGVFGANYSASGSGIAGVTGVAYASTGTTAGVLGNSNSSSGYGVEGIASVGGAAGFFTVNNNNANILQGSNNGVSKFTVDSAGDVTAAGAVSGSNFQIGGLLFGFGSFNAGNAFLGFAGSGANGVCCDTAVGVDALAFDVGIGTNTAVGELALELNTTGTDNTAIGNDAGFTGDGSYLTGSNNTALGSHTFFSTGTLTNATAVGFGAFVSESNALVLGNSANVGIGTSAPGHLLDVAGAVNFDSTGLNNGANFIDITLGANAGEGMSSSRTAAPNQYGIDIFTDFTRRISIEQHGNVGIGTTAPDNLLTVNGSADKPGGGSWGTFSDARLKTVNGGFTDGLSQVMRIQPIHYRYKPDNAMGIRDTDEHIGVVAQEVQKVIPEAVTENSKGYLLVNNDPIIWTMLNAIKEQQGEVQHEQAASKDQQAELTEALRLIKQQQSLLRAQSAAMQSLKAEVRETRETLRQVKAQMVAAQPTLVAEK